MKVHAMSNALLDYSSWSFQAVMILLVLYLLVGLINPAWVLASKRSTIVGVFVAVALIASTALYLVTRELPGGEETPAQINADPPPAAQP
jgi:protein-S-isoprenylcysteine O-methyltransferase Ste14